MPSLPFVSPSLITGVPAKTAFPPLSSIFEHTISSVGNVETGLKIGMKILTINEIEICNLKHSDIAKLLKKR